MSDAPAPDTRQGSDGTAGGVAPLLEEMGIPLPPPMMPPDPGRPVTATLGLVDHSQNRVTPLGWGALAGGAALLLLLMLRRR